MRKIYKNPTIRTISLISEGSILAESPGHIHIGIGKGTEQGSNALGNEKDMWGNEDIWK